VGSLATAFIVVVFVKVGPLAGLGATAIVIAAVAVAVLPILYVRATGRSFVHVRPVLR